MPGRRSSSSALPHHRGLTPEQIVRTAVELADRDGPEAVTVRGVAQALSITPMSLYHHLPTKDAMLDAMTDAVFAEVELPGGADGGGGWREQVEGAAVSGADWGGFSCGRGDARDQPPPRPARLTAGGRPVSARWCAGTGGPTAG